MADTLVARDYRGDVDAKRLLTDTLALGAQYRAQKRIKSPEAVSTALFDSAIRLAGNRGLLTGCGTERLWEREAFAAELRAIVARIGLIEAMGE